MVVDIEKQDTPRQLKLCELLTNSFYLQKKLMYLWFWKNYPLKMLSMFGTTYTCEYMFSNMKHINISHQKIEIIL